MSVATLKLQAGGTLVPWKHVYVERAEDEILLSLLSQGQYVNVLTPRQMGKSSLMVRTLYALRTRGFATVSVDLAAELGEATDGERYFDALLSKVARELEVPLNLDRFKAASPHDTPGQRFQRYFRETVDTVGRPIIVFLDEIDSTLKHPFTDGLFTAIRGMFNERSFHPAYRQVTFCLLGVATPNELIKDRRTTAYNVGTTLELRDFDLRVDDLSSFAEQISADPYHAWSTLQRILYWTGGQPYLTVRLCADLRTMQALGPHEVDRFVEDAFGSIDRLGSDAHFAAILRFVDTRLHHGLDALNVYRRILTSQQVKEEAAPAHLELKLSGLVGTDRSGHLLVRNRLYARLFNEQWIASTRPGRELANTRRRLKLARVAAAVLLVCTGFLSVRYLSGLGESRAIDWLTTRQIAVVQDQGHRLKLEFPAETTDALLAEAVDRLPTTSRVSTVVLAGTRVADLAPLGRLRELESLALDGSPVLDLAPLATLSRLRQLGLRGTLAADLRPLAALTELDDLDLSATPVVDTAPLAHLSNLQRLNLADTATKDLAVLAPLAKLQTLILGNTGVTDLAPLRSLRALRLLVLSDTRASDYAVLGELAELRQLDLSGTPIDDLAAVSGLRRLVVLNLSATRIADLEGLRPLSNLESLRLADTRITSVEPLAGLTRLKALDLSSTGVSSLTPLRDALGLELIAIKGTPITPAEADLLRGALRPPRGNLRELDRQTLDTLQDRDARRRMPPGKAPAA